MILQKSKKGFTLIELMVVISIIGFLSSVVIASLNTARIKSIDTQTYQEVNQYEKALALYYNDHNSYPLTQVGQPTGTPYFYHVGCLETQCTYISYSLNEATDIKSVMNNYIPSKITTQSETKSGYTWKGMIYGCAPVDSNGNYSSSGTSCKAAILAWPQQLGSCPNNQHSSYSNSICYKIIGNINDLYKYSGSIIWLIDGL